MALLPGKYVCLTLGAAKTAIAQQGFTLGNVTPQPTPSPTGPVPDTWIVTDQLPTAGTPSAYGTAIDLTVQAPPAQPAARTTTADECPCTATEPLTTGLGQHR